MNKFAESITINELPKLVQQYRECKSNYDVKRCTADFCFSVLRRVETKPDPSLMVAPRIQTILEGFDDLIRQSEVALVKYSLQLEKRSGIHTSLRFLL